MLIQCTKKLLDQLKIKPTVAQEEPLFSWHANITTVNRRKTIVLANDSNRYPIVLHGVKAKELKNIGKYIIEAIRETFIDESIKEEIVTQYLNASPTIIFTKTNGSKYTGRLTNICRVVDYYEEYIDTEKTNQSVLNRKLGKYIQKGDDKEYVFPYEVLFNDLKEMARKSIFSVKAIKIKVKLNLEYHNIWRRLVIPHNILFKDLHKIIQITFGWRDYHLHDFIIFRDLKPFVNLVQNEEAFDYPGTLPMKLDSEIKLSEYFPKQKKAIYRYDFGDNWVHNIEVEDFIFDYDKNYTVCLNGEGDSPPEDVGGEPGYDEFVSIINDPKHKEYKEMKHWASMQLHAPFDLDLVCRRLKYLD